MEAAGQQVMEAGTGRGARLLRRHLRGGRGRVRGGHRGALRPRRTVAGWVRRASVPAVLRQGEGLDAGGFLRLNWQGLEAERRAAGQPRERPASLMVKVPRIGDSALGLPLALPLLLACSCS